MAEAGTVSLDVVAGDVGDLQQQILDALASIDGTIPVDADVSGVAADVDAAIGESSAEVTVGADTSDAEAMIAELDGGTVDETVLMDTSAAQESLDGLSGSVNDAAGSLLDLGGSGGAATTASTALAGFAASAAEAAGATAVSATGFGALAVGIGLSVDAAMDAQVVQAQTDALIANQGASAAITAGQISDLANEILGYSGFSDEAVASGENMLLMFQNVSSEAAVNAGVFERTTRLGADLATVMGGDVTNAIRTLGRAIDDPTAGMGRLRRAGIQLTEQQQTEIQTLQEQGDLLGAQQELLDIVEGKVGGLAAAYGDTLAGQIDIAKESIGNLEEEMGNAFLPSILSVVTPLTDAATATANFAAETQAMLGPLALARQALDDPGAAGWIAQLTAGSPLLDGMAMLSPHLEAAGHVSDDLARALGGTADEAMRAAGGMDDLDQRIQDYLSDTFDVPDAQRALRGSFHDLFATLLREGHSADDVAASFEDIVRRTAELGQATGNMNDAADVSIAHLREMRDAGQLTGGQFDVLRDKIRALPDAKHIPVDAPGAHQTNDDLRRILDTAHGIPHFIDVHVSTNAGIIAADVAGAARALHSLELRASGGPVVAEEAYIVGERGPELFVPAVSGTILPELPAATDIRTAALGGATYNIVNHITVPATSPREFSQAVVDAMTDWQRANGTIPVRTM